MIHVAAEEIVDLLAVVVVVDFAEDELDVEELRVDLLGRLVVRAHDEYLGGLVTRRLRLGGLHLLEELLEDPHDGVVVLGAEDLRHKPAVLLQELRRQLERLQRQHIYFSVTVQFNHSN